MIASNLKNAARYRNIDEKIAACIDYAAKLNGDTPCGRYDVAKDVYVNVMEYTPKPSSEATIETHSVYADLQLILSGEEFMGYISDKDVLPIQDYDKERDIAMWKGNIALIPLREGDFALFFPGEPHAPSLHKTSGTIKKAVFKIKY